MQMFLFIQTLLTGQFLKCTRSDKAGVLNSGLPRWDAGHMTLLLYSSLFLNGCNICNIQLFDSDHRK